MKTIARCCFYIIAFFSSPMLLSGCATDLLSIIDDRNPWHPSEPKNYVEFYSEDSYYLFNYSIYRKPSDKFLAELNLVRRAEDLFPTHVRIATDPGINEFAIGKGQGSKTIAVNVVEGMTTPVRITAKVVNIFASDGKRIRNLVPGARLTAIVNVEAEDPLPPLIFASWDGQTSAVKQLLEKGADVNEKTKQGRTPLMAAVRWGHTETVKLLLNKGADVNAKDNNGRTALLVAIEKGGINPMTMKLHINLVKLLLDNGADVNANDIDGTALMHASLMGYIEIVKLLLDKGVDVNTKDIGGTALMHALVSNQTKIVELLISKGADVNTMGRIVNKLQWYWEANGML